MFRSTPRAFANDAKALSITQKALAKGFAGALSSEEQLFLYLPFEHQENVVPKPEAWSSFLPWAIPS